MKLFFGWWLVDERGSVRYRFEARLWNRLAREFAYSVGAMLDSAQGSFDLGERDAINCLFVRLYF